MKRKADARKPLGEASVDANVLAHGTGAIHVDACRVGDGGGTKSIIGAKASTTVSAFGNGLGLQGGRKETLDKGRWPANVLHDGSDEVLAAFPDAPGQQGPISSTAPSPKTSRIYGAYARIGEASAHCANDGDVGFKMQPGARRLDEGSAARFFFSAKADADDRLGSKHPTVKPLDLMRWLVRLVTPPGGVVLDCFAGTGTTGEAAAREGFCAILIERESEYRADIVRRMGLMREGALERRKAAVAHRKPADLPLFCEDGE